MSILKGVNRVPTVTIMDGAGRIMVVNEAKWAADLGIGRYRGWHRVTESHNGAGGALPLASFVQDIQPPVQQQTIQPMDSEINGAPRSPVVPRKRKGSQTDNG